MFRLCNRSVLIKLYSVRNETASLLFEKVGAGSCMLHTSTVCMNFEKDKQESMKARTKNRGLKKMKGKLVEIKSGMTIRELAEAMDKSVEHVNECLDKIKYAHGVKKSESWVITKLDVIAKIVKLSGFRFQLGGQSEINFEQIEADLMKQNETRETRPKPKPQDLIKRPPVVTIMGHVDHGKTTLLDALRGSNVVASEFGGITQHIGAFNCILAGSDVNEKPRSITFLDTPGHAIFSGIRSRGAMVTDIVVLVVAAEDGIMAQTVESIGYAKAANCPIIVAVNKIDKVSADRIERVKKDLLKHDLICEEFGGDVQFVPISALKRINLDKLKEEIWTRAEIMELKGDPKGLVEGYILESRQDTHRGKLATVLIQRGTLQRSQYLVAGTNWCKVKVMHDENSQSLDKVSLSQAVQVMGWKGLPAAGDDVLQVTSENRAKELVELRTQIAGLAKERQDAEAIKAKRKIHRDFYQVKLKERRSSARQNRVTFDELYGSPKQKERKLTGDDADYANSLNVIIKADCDSSLEAILDVLDTYPTDNKTKINIVHFEIGALKKTDLELAEMFDALIYCFNIPSNPLVEKNEVMTTDTKESKESKEQFSPIRHFNVIYKLFDDIKVELDLRAPLEEEEETIGEAEVLKMFDYEESSRKSMKVVGGRCIDGQVDKNSMFRVVRNGSVVYDKQACKSLKHLKTDVNTIKRNVEFGLVFESQEVNVQPGDRIQCYTIKMVKKPIVWDLGF